MYPPAETPVSRPIWPAILLYDSSSPTSRVYIDGFNLYHGLLQHGQYSRCKWLDLQRLFVALRQADEIVSIKYFTAFWPDDSGKRHKVYIRALGGSPLMNVIEGRFKRKTLHCRVRACGHTGDRSFRSFEEKETDVNIALSMIDDAYRIKPEKMILVSGDSDLIPAINLVRMRSEKTKIVVYIPGDKSRFRNATDMKAAADEARHFPAVMLPKFQLPNPITVAGAELHKPTSW